MNDDFFARLKLPEPPAAVLCALSGGADSMCLLELLLSVPGLRVAAAHYEHGIRGEESLRDCAFVEEYCGLRGIECFTGHGDVPAEALRRGQGTEETARELRYAFLERVADERGFELIATAHNADDNAETLLLNLVRGAGAAGLCGIPPRRGRIIRPLLGVTREEIELFLAERGIPHVEDSTNESCDYSRNRLRREVVPVLRSINPSFSRAAARTGELLRRDESFLLSVAEEFISANFDGSSLDAAKLAGLDPAVSSRVVRLLLGRGLSEKHVAAVLALLGRSEPGEADLPFGRVRVERGRLTLRPEPPRPIEERELPIPGAVTLGPQGLRICCGEDGGGEINNSFKTYRLKYESICGTLKLSSPQPGDSYRPERRGCTKSLKSLFSEKRYGAAERAATPVFRDGEGIVLVPPFGAAERCVPSPGDRTLTITVEKI